MITLDVQMPEMDGWSVLSALKGDEELKGIPVIMVSIVADQKKGYALGAVESMPKPIDRETLLKIVHRYAASDEDRAALVVEDDEYNRSLLSKALEDAGWSVMQAENGAVALDRLEDAIPDIILLDLMMPVMDGFEFVSEMRKREEWRAVPIVVVTAKDLTPEDRLRLTGGVEKVIQKGGFSASGLLEDIRNLVKRHERRSKAGEEGETE